MKPDKQSWDFRRAGTAGVICILMFTVACGQDEKAPRKKSSGNPPEKLTAVRRPVMVKLTRNQEESALEFARTHHPELARLLEQLRKTKSESGFSRGIREVHMAAQRLARVQEKQPQRFQTELKEWKTYSEIRLLTARWAMAQDPLMEKKILGLLRQRQQARLDRMQADREKLAERLRELDAEIDQTTQDFEQQLATEWSRLKKQAGTAAKARKRMDGRNEARPRRKSEAKTAPAKSNQN